MSPHRVRVLSSLLLVLWATSASACPGPSPADPVDGGRDAGAADATPDVRIGDAGPDASSGCIPVTVGTFDVDFIDDVSASYVAPLSPAIDGQTYALYLTFERYGDAEYVGTFSIAGSRDDNRSTCAHCTMAFTGLTRDHGFFASAGTLTLRAEPFGLLLDARLEGLRLVEVTIGGATLMSTPVPGGACLEVATVDVMQTFTPDGWTCPASQYGDGATCQCTCGVIDPDCDGTRDPVDCLGNQLCEIRRDSPTFEPYCATSCDRDAGRSCSSGVCAIDAMERGYCDATPLLRSSVGFGQQCATGSVYCAPVGTSFWDGICDQAGRGDGVCRPLCTTDAECDAAAFERCFHLFSDTGLGHCAPRFPAAWTCAPESFGDGAHCDCGCGAHDPDCELAGTTPRGCAAGDVCVADVCATPPANETCASAPALALGTAGAPARTSGSTLAARDDYAAQPDTGTCATTRLDGPDVVYAVTLAAGDTLDVVLTPDQTLLSLYLLGPGDAASACDATATHCVGGAEGTEVGSAVTLHTTVASGGTYYLVVDSFGGFFSGPFTLDASVSH
ncbi:MAG: PPC domain-containing protein [Sandaracinus sp.]